MSYLHVPFSNSFGLKRSMCSGVVFCGSVSSTSSGIRRIFWLYLFWLYCLQEPLGIAHLQNKAAWDEIIGKWDREKHGSCNYLWLHHLIIILLCITYLEKYDRSSFHLPSCLIGKTDIYLFIKTRFN